MYYLGKHTTKSAEHEIASHTEIEHPAHHQRPAQHVLPHPQHQGRGAVHGLGFLGSMGAKKTAADVAAEKAAAEQKKANALAAKVSAGTASKATVKAAAAAQTKATALQQAAVTAANTPVVTHQQQVAAKKADAVAKKADVAVTKEAAKALPKGSSATDIAAAKAAIASGATPKQAAALVGATKALPAGATDTDISNYMASIANGISPAQALYTTLQASSNPDLQAAGASMPIPTNLAIQNYGSLSAAQAAGVSVNSADLASEVAGTPDAAVASSYSTGSTSTAGLTPAQKRKKAVAQKKADLLAKHAQAKADKAAAIQAKKDAKTQAQADKAQASLDAANAKAQDVQNQLNNLPATPDLTSGQLLTTAPIAPAPIPAPYPGYDPNQYGYQPPPQYGYQPPPPYGYQPPPGYPQVPQSPMGPPPTLDYGGGGGAPPPPAFGPQDTGTMPSFSGPGFDQMPGGIDDGSAAVAAELVADTGGSDEAGIEQNAVMQMQPLSFDPNTPSAFPGIPSIDQAMQSTANDNDTTDNPTGEAEDASIPQMPSQNLRRKHRGQPGQYQPMTDSGIPGAQSVEEIQFEELGQPEEGLYGMSGIGYVRNLG